jgi:hypothetical protein
MVFARTPQIGSWYASSYLQSIFEVVAIDDDQGTIEIQYENGDLDELEFDEWQTGRFLKACPPDDAQGAFGVSTEDDWEDDLQPESPLYDSSDRYNLDFNDFE